MIFLIYNKIGFLLLLYYVKILKYLQFNLRLTPTLSQTILTGDVVIFIFIL